MGKTTGTPIVEAYGLTEASPGVCVNPLNISNYTGSIGLPIPSTDVQLRDGQGNLVPVGEAGELWIKGPQIMKGYWNRPDETAKVMDANGWLETGDIAVMNEQGWLKIVDRKKRPDCGVGFQCVPQRSGRRGFAPPQSARSGVHRRGKRTNGRGTQIVCGEKDASLNKDELIEYCRTQLTGYKVPREIEFRDELPKSMWAKSCAANCAKRKIDRIQAA